MPGTDLSAKGEGGNALQSLLNRSVIYEKAGAVVPRDLLQFGFFGSIIVIATGLIALVWPEPESIRSGEFYLVLDGAAAGLTSLMKELAVVAIVAGLLLLAVDLYLMKVPTSERWRAVVVGQATLGGVAGTIGTLFLALIILNLVLWIIIGALILMLIGGLLSVLASS